jgi:putative membrane-bound dehydrogenase-like protein
MSLSSLRHPLFVLLLVTACARLHAAEEFPIPKNTEKDKSSPMAPGDVVRTAKLPPGFSLSVFAAEPDVHNPIAITTDERGRLWVAENYSWAGNGDGGFRAELRDRIVIYEDVTGDGIHDRRTVFWDDARRLTSIEVGRGGVYALCLPQLLFLSDADRNDRPDGPPRVVLDGFDLGNNSHTPANGLRWGPDGWLYGRQGIQVTSYLGTPGASQSQRVRLDTGIWRYHPKHNTVEAVMHGMTNSWGFDFDRRGEMFVINTVIGHLWHLVSGVHTERMYGVDANPYVFQLVKQTADHVHWDTGEAWNDVRKGVTDKTAAAGGGHAHIGLMIYQGDNWPAEYRDRVYTLNLHGRRINCDIPERQGAGFTAKHGPDFCFIQDPWFRGMDLITGPDGGVFIADWSDSGECHDHDGVHRTSGRIYKLVYEKPKPTVPFDLAKRSDSQLVTLLDNDNQWWVRQARRLLTERAERKELSADVAKQLKRDLKKQTAPDRRIRILETLHGIGAADQAILTASFASLSESERSCALRFLLETITVGGEKPTHETSAALSRMIAGERSGLVLLHAASALQRLPNEEARVLAENLCDRVEFEQDRMFPYLVWYGIEPLVAREPTWAVRLAEKSKLPLISENITRRLALEGPKFGKEIDLLLAAALRIERRPSEAIVAGLAQAMHGVRRAQAPANWKSVAAKYADTSLALLNRHVQGLNVVYGEGRAIEELKTLVADAKAEPEARRQALTALVEGRPADYAPTLWKLMNDRTVTMEALRGLAQYDDPGTPEKVLGRLAAFNAAERTEAIALMTVRPTYAAALLKAVRDGKLKATEISAFHARQIRDFDDPTLNKELTELWGEVRVSAAEKKVLMATYKAALSAETLAKGDLSAGRALYQKSCASCHVLYGAGRLIGPDLTGSNRKNIDYLLENIVDPSASIAANFRSVGIVLNDGRAMSGVVGAQNDLTLTLLTAQEPQTFDRKEIEEIRQSTVSLMPDNLLQNLTADQVRDLFAYLMSVGQVPLPKD